MTYHHGRLRQTLIDAAAKAVAGDGAAALSLRALAREAGVSHTAPRHHFGDKRGLLTALATVGYGLLADDLLATGDDFLEMGVAYVRFALKRPGHFAVMYRPDLVDESDPDLQSARARTREALIAGAATLSRNTAAPEIAGASPVLPPRALLAWSAAHGLANLALAGTLSKMGQGAGVDELSATARKALNQLGHA